MNPLYVLLAFFWFAGVGLIIAGWSENRADRALDDRIAAKFAARRIAGQDGESPSVLTGPVRDEGRSSHSGLVNTRAI